MLPSTTDLAYFLEVANELHFSRAAKKLHVSQPSLSLAIQRLEKLIATDLFIRHKSGITLTRAGHELFNYVKKVMMQWDEAIANIKAENQLVKGKVTIGCHSTLAHFMTNMVARLLSEHPGLEIHFQYELTPRIMENISKGHLDIGVVTDPYLHTDVIIQQIAMTEFTYWVSSEPSLKFDLYDEETVIICDPELAPTQFLLKELEKQRKGKRLRLCTMNDIETIVTMTAEKSGIGILPTAWTEFRFGSKLKKIPNAPIYLKPLCLVYRPENKNVMAMQVVLQSIKDLIK